MPLAGSGSTGRVFWENSQRTCVGPHSVFPVVSLACFQEFPQRVPQREFGGSRRLNSRVPAPCLRGSRNVFPGSSAACFGSLRSVFSGYPLHILEWVLRERHIRFYVCLELVFGVACGILQAVIAFRILGNAAGSRGGFSL